MKLRPESDLRLDKHSTQRFKVNTKTWSTFISELRPHSSTIALYSWILVFIHVSWDCITTGVEDAAALVSCLRAQTRPVWIRSPWPVLVPGLGWSTLCWDLVQLFKPFLKEETICLDEFQSPFQFYSAVKPHSSIIFFFLASTFSQPFSKQKTFIGLTYSSYMLQLHNQIILAKSTAAISILGLGVLLSAEFWVKNNITITLRVLLWTLWNKIQLLRTDVIVLIWGFTDKSMLKDIVTF